MKILTPLKQVRFRNCGTGVFIPLMLACFAFPQTSHAVSPPPDGGYPGGNTAEGQDALLSLTSGTYNTAVGLFSLNSVTQGSFNTALGAATLLVNTGSDNTASGAGALLSNTTGGNNTANGESALFYNTTGGSNTATGSGALQSNTTGNENTANGVDALHDNTIAVKNTATGVRALDHNITGSANTANGVNALVNNTSGADNTALGTGAGVTQTTGNGNVYIGRGTTGVAGENNKTYIRNINVTGLPATNVTVDLNTGLLGHATSSRRYKEQIEPMDKASDALYQLKPVTFRYKKEIDHTRALSFGLIAEEVAEVNPDLIARDSTGKPETVRYEAVNAMLLNEFLKEHKKVEQQQSTIAELKSTLAQQRTDFEGALSQQRKDSELTAAQQQREIQTLVASVNEQAARIQRLSAQIDVSKAVLPTIADSQ